MELKDNRELLYDLYHNKEYSLSKIAAIYSVTSMTVRAWLHRNNIATRPSTQTVYKELKSTDFSYHQKSLIVGSLLGDGSITLGKDCINARFVERHGEKQKDYLLWKRDTLKPFTTSKITEIDEKIHKISGVTCNVSKSYMFSTISHPYLTELRNNFYVNGTKVIPSDLYNMLDGISMAIWFCDDGSFTYSKKHGVYRMDLHTESFTYKENVFLCREILSRYFGEAFRINSRQYKSGKAFYICLSGKERVRQIISDLKLFIPECMLYKFKDYIT